MADTWVPNITEVKRAKRRPSKIRNKTKMIVAGGLNEAHVCHSAFKHPIKNEIARKRA
jgi:hypothetical protein